MQRFSVLLFVGSKQTRCFEFTSQMAEMAEYRFRAAKTFEQEEKCVASAIPKSTQYKNKWAVGIFEQWQKVRVPKVTTLEPGGLFKNYDLHKVQSLEFPLLEMDALSLNYWLAKFIQEVAKPSKETGIPTQNHISDCVRNTSIHGGKECKLGFQSPRCIRQKVQ